MRGFSSTPMVAVEFHSDADGHGAGVNFTGYE
jgi:hypothetical protein